MVQRDPRIVKGPYYDLQMAKTELTKIAGNGKSRMMVEIIDGVVQKDPHYISGISQKPSEGFNKYWDDWYDINAMIAIVEQYLGKYLRCLKIKTELKFNFRVF